MTSAEQICNIALLRSGSKATIDALTGSSMEAIACNALYEATRDQLLAEHGWSFATRRVSLAKANITRDGWESVYDLPADFIATQMLNPTTRNPAGNERTRFKLEYDDTYGPILLTDVDPADLVYTFRQTTVVFLSPHFVQALAWRLASELTFALPVKPAAGVNLDQRATLALQRAIAIDMNQQSPDQPPEAEHVRARS